jgi:hypothetical protein
LLFLLQVHIFIFIVVAAIRYGLGTVSFRLGNVKEINQLQDPLPRRRDLIPHDCPLPLLHTTNYFPPPKPVSPLLQQWNEIKDLNTKLYLDTHALVPPHTTAEEYLRKHQEIVDKLHLFIVHHDHSTMQFL